MKLKNILFSLIAVLVSVLGMNVNAATTAPSSFTVRGGDLHLLSASNYISGANLHFFYKVNSAGKVIYCIDQTKQAPEGSSYTYNLDKELSAKYAYILENGYPSKSLTGNNDKDYFITGMAIWYVVNPSNPIFANFHLSSGKFHDTSSDVVVWMNKLVSGANSASYVEPSIKVNNSNSNMTLTSDGKYYVSNKMSVTTSGKVGNYTVSLSGAPSGTVVTDTNGNSKSTFGTNDKFMVKMPASSVKKDKVEISVNVSATGTINKAYSYSTSNSSIQSVMALYPESKDVKANTTLKVAPIVTKVQISKTDATTGKELPGAKLTIKKVDGDYTYSWVSSNEPKIIEGLEPGKYTLTEEIAPEGYVLSTTTVEFEIKADGSTTKVEMKNELAKPNTVIISKQDATNGQELPGAKLELRDENGNLVEAWVSGEEPHKIEGLKPGKYYLTETIAPEGYELSTETVEFTVKEDGTVDGKVIMYNKPETIIEVPSTGSFKTITTSLIGLIIIGLGSMVIYKNYKKNEEI